MNLWRLGTKTTPAGVKETSSSLLYRAVPGGTGPSSSQATFTVAELHAWTWFWFESC